MQVPSKWRMDKWTNFYAPYFPTEADAQAFVDSVEALNITDPRHPSKIMMHQVQRLVTLADQIHNILPGRAAMRVFFLMVCAENVTKLHAKFEGEGQSKAHAVKFFDDFVTANDKHKLAQSFIQGDKSLDVENSAKLLYAVRNAVVHEGNYWSFDFAETDAHQITGDPENPVIVQITYSEMRDIVVRAGIQAVNSFTP